MNKALTRFFTEQGLTVSGNTAYGEMGGYEVNASLHTMTGGPTPLHIHFSCFTTPEQKNAIEGAVQTAGLSGVALLGWTPYGMVIGSRLPTFKKFAQRLAEALCQLSQILSANGASGVGYCPVCGGSLSEESKVCLLNGMQITMDCACVEAMNAAVRNENQAFRDAPNHYLRGFGGAVLGGLVGALVAYVLFQIGFISALSVFVAIALGAFLYQKFGGKPNAGMVVIVSLTSFAFMIAAVFGVYLIAISNMLAEEGLNMTAVEAFGQLMENSDFSREFLTNLWMTILFSVIGVVGEIIMLMRKIKRPSEIE